MSIPIKTIHWFIVLNFKMTKTTQIIEPIMRLYAHRTKDTQVVKEW